MMRAIALLLLSALACMAQQSAKPDIYRFHDQTPLAAVPTSPADAALNRQVAGGSVGVVSLWLVNTNSSTTRTVTVSCKTSGVAFVVAAIPGVASGGNNIPVQFPADDLQCAGGVTWVADGAGVNGYITVRY